jgi:hypothetical protein
MRRASAGRRCFLSISRHGLVNSVATLSLGTLHRRICRDWPACARQPPLVFDLLATTEAVLDCTCGASPELGRSLCELLPTKLTIQQTPAILTLSPSIGARQVRARTVRCEKQAIIGRPNPSDISISHVERHNLSMRMQMRRFTRLTNTFSKKLEHHVAMAALYFFYYNFCRVHQTLRVTPCMEAGVTDRVWGVEDIVGFLK